VIDQHDTASQLDPFTAGIQLQTVVDQLTQPTVHHLDRDPTPGTDAWQQQRDDQALADEIWAALRHTIVTRDAALARRQLDVLDLIERRREAREVPTVTLPSLLHQLQDAIPNGSDNSGSSGGTGASRSPLALAALDLLTEIATTAGVRAGSGSPAFTEQLRSWCERVCGDETQVVRAAELAADWPERARTLLDPPKKWTMPGACPACGKTTAHVEQDGEQVRRPAIEFDPAAGKARCLRCSARWDGEQALRQLNKALIATASDTEE